VICCDFCDEFICCDVATREGWEKRRGATTVSQVSEGADENGPPLTINDDDAVNY